MIDRKLFLNGEVIIVMIGLIILVIVVYYLFSSHSQGTYRGDFRTTGNNPLDILDERYAHGEISREEYLERKEVLTGKKRSVTLTKE
jgi:putative membrane protein